MDAASGTTTSVVWYRTSAVPNAPVAGTATVVGYTPAYPWYATVPSDGDVPAPVDQRDVEAVVSERFP